MFRAFLHAPVAVPERRGFLLYMLPRFTSACVANSRSRVCPHNTCMLNNMNLIKETTSLKDYMKKAPPKRGQLLGQEKIELSANASSNLLFRRMLRIVFTGAIRMVVCGSRTPLPAPHVNNAE